MLVRAVLIAAAIFAGESVVAGIGFAGPARADSVDDSFLQDLDNHGVQYGDPVDAIRVAMVDVCGRLDSHPWESIGDVVSGVATSTSWSNADSAYLTGAAIAAYCPQFQSVVNAPPTDAPSVPNVPVV
ncbi:DUF732 domain-containing protein [Mycobacterium sp. Marseille-P9652]|uniref:DUF732 domain-containing protein n=1 Tax=Mycobacterium sp. Marseille-P9652 TaxID=2654950 RepID=UPI0012E7C3C1|nr:DUF732 domain-containing protein [Mycobacterium sp. Marseille-P9652]